MQAMRTRPLWLLLLPVLLVSEAAGHAVVARLLDHGGQRHRSLDLLAAASALGLGLAALVLRVVASFRSGARPLPSWRLAAIPPLAFLAQEHVERLAHEGDAWLTAAEPAVLAGLLLQSACGVIALWLTRALLRAADRLACALARSRRHEVGAGCLARLVPFEAERFRLSVLASQQAGRAPPAAA
jgi:hypothetical protein